MIEEGEKASRYPLSSNLVYPLINPDEIITSDLYHGIAAVDSCIPFQSENILANLKSRFGILFSIYILLITTQHRCAHEPSKTS